MKIFLDNFFLQEESQEYFRLFLLKSNKQQYHLIEIFIYFLLNN